MIRAEQAFEPQPFASVGQAEPVAPRDPLLTLHHQAGAHPGRSLAVMAAPDDVAHDPGHLSEGERAVRALTLGAALGLVLAFLARRR